MADETGCRGSEDGGHCEHWYDDEAPCCACGDDGGLVHGDHWPSLDCAACAARLRDGRTTWTAIYELAERRYKRFRLPWGTPPHLRPIPLESVAAVGEEGRMPEVEPCSMCDDREATTMWGLPVCQPCAVWLEYLDERLRALHPEPPERYIDRARRAIRQRRALESVRASDEQERPKQ